MPKPKIIEDRDQLEKLAPVMKAPIKRHVFVCNGKSCSQVGSAEVKAEFERLLEQKGLRQGKESKGRNPMGEIVLTECGSVGFCCRSSRQIFSSCAAVLDRASSSRVDSLLPVATRVMARTLE